jgi:hypothetical protein
MPETSATIATEPIKRPASTTRTSVYGVKTVAIIGARDFR